MRKFDRGGRGFLQWVKANQPRVYRGIANPIKAQPGLKGLGLAVPATDLAVQTPATPATKSWVDSIKDLAMAAAQTYLTREQLQAQRKVLDIQLQRAQAGQAPLDIDLAQYGLTPTATVGLAPQTRNLLLWGGLALAAAFILPRVFGGRR